MLSAQLNEEWEVDFVPALKIKQHSLRFVDVKHKMKFQDIDKCSVYVNLLLLSNLRTGFIHFQILHTRSFKELRVALETFLHIFGIKKLKIFCDSEGAFLKSETLSGGGKEKHVNFLNLREGKEMIESNDIRF